MHAEGPDMEISVPFSYPAYNVQLDPMSQKLRIKVDCGDSNKSTLFFHKLHVFINGNRLVGSLSTQEMSRPG